MGNLEQIDIHKAKELIDQGLVTLLDIRDISAFEQSHIPHAKHISDDNIEQFVSETDKTQNLLCYCYHGFSSQSAGEYFLQNGFEKVYSIIGGFEEWRQTYSISEADG